MTAGAPRLAGITIAMELRIVGGGGGGEETSSCLGCGRNEGSLAEARLYLPTLGFGPDREPLSEK